jgi:hypothetical protein
LTVASTATSRRTGAPRRRSVARILLNRLSIRLFGAVFVLSFLVPRHGSSVPLCWVQGLVGLPCPGCGMSRSFANISQLSWTDAWGYHPFGWVFYPLVVALALANLLSRRHLDRIRGWLEAREGALRPAYLTVVVAFIAYGAVRFIFEALVHGPSPGWG